MIIVVNFGGQYAHLIGRRIRELGVKSTLVSPSVDIKEISKQNPSAIIFSGSPFSCYQKNAPYVSPKIYELGIPILGICYGQQLMAHQLQGKVSPHEEKQFGREIINIKQSLLFEGLLEKEIVWFSHGDQVDTLPKGFSISASSKSAKIAAMENPAKKFFGVQFHPEVAHTQNGTKILKNFLFKISNAKKDWDIEKTKEKIIKNLKEEVGSAKVIMALSGGVDSLVAATLLKQAIGKNLHLVFIDTGLLRKYDLADLKDVIKKVGFTNVKIINAQKRFLDALKGISDPEEKRKKIAQNYFKVFEEEAKKIPGAKFLGQGTIYPDRIESAGDGKLADKIKSHHNLSVPKKLNLKIIEPIGDLYKDEVRKLGKILGIDQQFLNRHPFPGPGLSIRVLGEVTTERLKILRQADEIFISELIKAGIIYNKEADASLRSSHNLKEADASLRPSGIKEVSQSSTSLRSSSRSLHMNGTAGLKVGQALAALLPVKSVGVMGDSRTYQYIISLRCVDTADFMTADWTKIPPEILEKISSRIVNEVRGVNRVVYDITQKPPATIEYE